MLRLKYLPRKLVTSIVVAVFTFTLVLYPSILLPTQPLGWSDGNDIAIEFNQDSGVVLAQDVAPQASPKSAKPAKKSKSNDEGIDFFKMAMAALAGLVLFIFGVTRLSEGLEEIGTDKMKNFLGKCTSNRFAGVLTGAVATTVLESSSVTIIMVIAMVSAGVLTFVQSLGVVLGSNIGTAVGAQIISLNIELYVPLLMFAGLMLLFLGRDSRQKTIGVILLGFGLMFYGLEAIDEAMKPFRDYEPFISWMESLGNNPWMGAIVGAIFTIVIQSSSATVAIVITLATSGLIALPAGIAIMLGAEVGTCADTLLATVGRGSAALRTGLFHLLFNLVSAVLGILFAPQLVQLAQSISGGAGVGRQVANAQMLFNIIGVVVVIGLLPLIARFLARLIPDSQADIEKRNRRKESEPQLEPTV